jgi:hypothetical protein
MPNIEELFLPRDIRQHPVVGFGLSVKPLAGKMCASPHEAFQYLCFADWTELDTPGVNGAWMTMSLAPGRKVQIDVAKQWNWSVKDTRRFISDLRESDLIDDELAINLTGAVRSSRRVRESIPSAKRAAVMAKTSGRCVYCMVRLTTTPNLPNSFHADHVLPVIEGGTDDIGNLIPACAKCNGEKGAKSMLAFVMEKKNAS